MSKARARSNHRGRSGESVRKLSEQQQQDWDINGFIHLEGVFDEAEVEFFSNELDRIRLLPGYEPGDDQLGHYAWMDHAKDLDPEGFMDRRILLTYGKPFVDLIDRPEVFDLIVDIMGVNLMLSMTQAIVRASTETFDGYTHTDGGEGLREIRVTETSRPIAMKALYLLSDVHEEDAGAFTVYPGSHRTPFPFWRKPALHPESMGCVQLFGQAGDCFLFPHSLWHGPSRNTSGRARKTLLYNYCQMFVRSYDHEVTPDVLEQCTPRQRRLLGDLGYEFRPGSYFYVPTDQEAVVLGG